MLEISGSRIAIQVPSPISICYFLSTVALNIFSFLYLKDGERFVVAER